MSVRFTIDQTRRLRLWRLSGVVTLEQFKAAYAGLDSLPPEAGAYNVLLVFAQQTALHEMDRNALGTLRQEAGRRWREMGLEHRLRGAFLCPTNMHETVVRLYAMEVESDPDYLLDIRTVATREAAEAWLGQDLSGLDLPDYADTGEPV